jgi:hypothetical protein
MTNENRELNNEELGFVAGGGIVDNVLPESEASTAAFLKQFAETSQRFNAFINAPLANASVANQG